MIRSIPSGVVALAIAFALEGCVLQSTWEAEVARSRALKQELGERETRLDEFEKRVRELLQRQSNLELSREEAQKERARLLEQFEDLRIDRESLRVNLEEERIARLRSEQQIENLSDTYGSLVESLEKEVQAGRLEVERLEGRLQVRALDRILFASGSADIKPEGRDVLERVATQIRKLPGQRISVEGHTDDVPISTARFPSNWELSSARASGVVRAFVDFGIAADKLSATGYGSQRPIGDNTTAEGRSRNRRIEIILVPEE